MSSKPLVSAIIIFYNTEKFLEEAIQSVLAQTCTHWELLLVDDGSTDGSTAIAQRYVRYYPDKVRYLEHEGHENKGMSAARNLGFRYARGEYIALLDADDVWLPNKLERQVSILTAHPEAEMLYGATQYWYGWTGNPEDVERDHVPDIGVRSDTLFAPPKLSTLLYPLGNAFTPPCMSNLLMRREMVERVGGSEECFNGLYEDQAFLAKVYLNESVLVVNELWDRYRIHPDSCMAKAKKGKEYHSVRFFFLEWLEKYMSANKIHYPDVSQVLESHLWPYRHPILDGLRKRSRRLSELIRAHALTSVLKIGRATMPAFVRHWLWTQWRYRPRPPVGFVRMGSLRRVTPISTMWPNRRGRPIDRYYIEKFLEARSADIQGNVLEIGDASYTQAFGGDRVMRSEVLHAPVGDPGPEVTIIADLTSADHVASNTFDCIILTQTLQLIYDLRSAVETIYRILKPGGVVLVTFPGITHLSHKEKEEFGWYWSFTSCSVRRLFEEAAFSLVTVETHGNVLAASAFLYGLGMQELRRTELDYHDPDYEMIITARAAKPKM